MFLKRKKETCTYSAKYLYTWERSHLHEKALPPADCLISLIRSLWFKTESLQSLMMRQLTYHLVARHHVIFVKVVT